MGGKRIQSEERSEGKAEMGSTWPVWGLRGDERGSMEATGDRCEKAGWAG